MFAQNKPGKPDKKETKEKRIAWFADCLEKLADKCNKLQIKTIAFPDHIGCGLAQGDWLDYRLSLNRFATELVPDIKVYILKKI